MFTADVTQGPVPLTVTFDGSGNSDPNGGRISYDWNFGDDTFGVGAVVHHTYQTPGSYTARLLITDDGGLRAFDTIVITATEPGISPPEADAGVDLDTLMNESIRMNGSVTTPDCNSIVSWLWTIEQEPAPGSGFLGDSDQPNALFRGSVAGDYVLSLVVSDGSSNSEPDFVAVRVSENLPPTAVALADVTSGAAPLTVKFESTQSTDPEGRPLSCRWTFGDSSPPETDAIITHTYDAPGTYESVLSVQDDVGQVDEATILISVSTANSPPLVEPTARPDCGEAPLDAQITAKTSVTNSADNASMETSPRHVSHAPETNTSSAAESDRQEPVSDSPTVAVNPVTALSVRSALVVRNPRQPNMGNITVWADFDASTPAPTDVISVDFSGVSLLKAPFSTFKSGLKANVYWLSKRGLRVRINLEEHRIFVNRNRADFSLLESASGVDVVVSFGSNTVVENIMMEMISRTVLKYRRPE